MKIAAWSLVLFALLLAAVAICAPATLVDARLARLTGGQLRLADAGGTWWQGRGTLGDAAGTWRVPVAWKVDPGALAAGRLGVEFVAAAPGMPQGRIDATAGTLTLADVHARMPAQALPAYARGLDRTAFGGSIAITVPRLAWSEGEGSGTLALRWTDARVVGPLGLVDLGTVELPLIARGTGVTGTITASGGDVRASGNVAASLAGASVDATLAASPGASPGVVRALSALGAPDAGGAVRIGWRSGPR